MDRSLALQISRDDLRRVRVLETSPAEPGPGEVLFAVERFGVSANNVTYAQRGDALRYWDLFPAEAGWGQIPAWGYLRAVASRAGEVEAGRRAFGLCPMSTHVLLRPGRGDAAGFRDASIHRSAVSPVYNSYFWADGDQPDRRADDGLTVLRPVFWLSFTLDHHLARNGALFSGVVITSASSKAAIGLGYLLRRRGVAAVGLTSPRHVGFVEETSVYDRVVGYDQLGALAALAGSRPVLVDIAGNSALRQQIDHHMGGRLTSVLAAGRTHRDGSPASSGVPDDGTGMFSAPQQIRDLSRQWGWHVLSQRYTSALTGFAESATWLAIETARGIDEAARLYQRVLDNSSPPAVAHIVDLSAAPRVPPHQAEAGPLAERT
jgi:Protein of unknown function (DUF2855)